jgi:hypothetical protein
LVPRWKGLLGTKTVAYFPSLLATKKNRLMKSTPSWRFDFGADAVDLKSILGKLLKTKYSEFPVDLLKIFFHIIS